MPVAASFAGTCVMGFGPLSKSVSIAPGPAIAAPAPATATAIPIPIRVRPFLVCAGTLLDPPGWGMEAPRGPGTGQRYRAPGVRDAPASRWVARRVRPGVHVGTGLTLRRSGGASHPGEVHL